MTTKWIWTLGAAIVSGIAFWFLQPRRRRWRNSLLDEVPRGVTLEVQRFVLSFLCGAIIAVVVFIAIWWAAHR